jgi:serine/threonine protein kinase
MYHTTSQTFLTLENEPFASGGEGNLFKIIESKNNIVKIYYPSKRTQEREAKVKYMLAHQPDFQKFGHSATIWVSDMVYDSGNFAGFTMPFAQGIKLEYLCGSKVPSFLGKEWQKYDLKHKDAFYLRLKLCFNIAAAISQIHATGHYVITDLKPDNIIINSAGLVSIVDIDFFQISANDQILFPATAQTPEYSPADKSFTQAWDRFSMAVIFYRLLFGIHPFTGSCHAPYDNCHSIEEMMKSGLFPHSESKKAHFKMIPPPHLKFSRLDTQTRALFLQAFENEQRPSAEEWAQALYAYSKMNVVVEVEEETKPAIVLQNKERKRVDFEKAEKLYASPFLTWKGKVSKRVDKFLLTVANIMEDNIVSSYLLLLLFVIFGGLMFVNFLKGVSKPTYQTAEYSMKSHEEIEKETTILESKWGVVKIYINKSKQQYSYTITNALGKEETGKYDSISVSENKKLAKVWKDGKLGFIDSRGSEVAPCIYKGTEPLIGVVNENGKYGFVDIYGNLVVDYKYDNVSIFEFASSESVTVWCGDKKGKIDRDGKEIEPCNTKICF